SRNYGVFPRLVFLPVPLINSKYFANALKKKGYIADTLMTGYFSISNKADFDIYFHEITDKLKTTLKFKISFILGAHEDYLNYKIFDYAILNYDVFVMPFSGGVLSSTQLQKFEAQLLHSLGAKTATFAYGYDFWQYSKIADTAYRHAIIANYPEMGRKEYLINENYKYWAEHSDFIMGSMATDGLGRWDMLPVNYITIDTSLWNKSKKKSNANGINDVVMISHSPNHRYVKGTEFIIDAVNKLKLEGFLIELILIEKKTNNEVREILENEVDIHIEQLVYTGYALSAIEGMACGLPVITNEENEFSTKVLRRYSFLSECPAVSASPENIIEVLRCLVKNPILRHELGVASRKYVEKYHSEKTAQIVFSKIIDKIWFKKESDLMSFFHPLNPESYNNSLPKVEHPLFENKIPSQYYNNIN
ncbi:MAG TPA: aminotransferase, partial [Bacteroidia bacterium]|nr:aminotransferase [Bacteroidia bacterium]